MYGGRVIDDFDRRTIRVYMDEYFGDFLFDNFQPFHFYHDDTVDYKIPECAETREDFIGETKKNSQKKRPLFLYFSAMSDRQNMRGGVSESFFTLHLLCITKQNTYSRRLL
jgi:hypothetical protein